MMGKRSCPISKRHVEILKALSHLPKKERKILLRYADSKLAKCICECAYNVLKGNVPLDQKQKTHLKRHVNLLRKLARTGENIDQKKKIIQTGGGNFLPALVLPLLALLANNGIR